MLRSIITVALLAAVSGMTAAVAQPVAEVDGPAEAPPQDYAGESYVDSKGCLFLRVSVNGVVNWVPRVTGDRKVQCGQTPTLPPPKPEAAEAPVEETEPAKAEIAESKAAAPEPVPAPAPRKVAHAAKPARPPAPAPIAVTDATGRTLGCFPDVPLPQRVKMSDGSVRTLCTRGEGDVSGARVPVAAPQAEAAKPQVAAAAPSPAPKPEPLRTMIVKEDGLWRQIEVTDAVPAGKSRIVMGHYIQVGAFGRPTNAEVARQELRKTGLPVRTAMVRKGADTLELVLAGPFDDAASARKALETARNAGFSDAFHL